MQDWRWALATVLGALGLWMAASSVSPATPALAGRDLGPEYEDWITWAERLP